MFKIILLILAVLFLWYLVFSDIKACIKAIIYIPCALYYVPVDTYHYIKERKWRQFNENGIVIYGGLFGTGKTLSMVDYVTHIYNSYDNIEVVSNVTFKNIPYTDFKYFEQLKDPVPEGITRIFVCDEFGSLFNSRNYQKNTITEKEYLTVLNQLRKEKKLLLITSQRYGMLDKVFRQVAKVFYDCKKTWRFFWRYAYDPYDLEYTSDPRLVKSVNFFPQMLFATKKVYSAYDTHEFVCDFDNILTITDRSNTDSLVNADYKYSPKARKGYYKR